MTTQTIGVFGVSGATGQQILSIAKQSNIPVMGFGRADLANLNAVQTALATVDSVICAFGPRAPYRDVFCAHATQLIITAMQERGLRRLICLTGAMIGDYPEHWSWGTRLLVGLYRRQQPILAADRSQQEAIVKASGLDWTLVKPPRLTNKPARNTYQAGSKLRVSLFSKLSRADLGQCLLKLSQSDEYLQQAVFVKY